MTLRIMGSQNWWFEIPEACYTESNPSRRRVQWFSGKLQEPLTKTMSHSNRIYHTVFFLKTHSFQRKTLEVKTLQKRLISKTEEAVEKAGMMLERMQRMEGQGAPKQIWPNSIHSWEILLGPTRYLMVHPFLGLIRGHWTRYDPPGWNACSVMLGIFSMKEPPGCCWRDSWWNPQIALGC